MMGWILHLSSVREIDDLSTDKQPEHEVHR